LLSGVAKYEPGRGKNHWFGF